GLLFAGGVAVAESHAVPALAVEALALVLAAQGMLQFHAEMASDVRIVVAVVDLAAVALAISPALRGLLRRHVPAAAAALLAAALLGAAPFARFRVRDRTRALALESSVHVTYAHLFAPAWGWLDRHGGDGTVAVSCGPSLYFVYPAMGPL